MLVRTFRDNVGAMASPNLAILTNWKPLDGTFENSLGKEVGYTIKGDILT